MVRATFHCSPELQRALGGLSAMLTTSSDDTAMTSLALKPQHAANHRAWQQGSEGRGGKGSLQTRYRARTMCQQCLCAWLDYLWREGHWHKTSKGTFLTFLGLLGSKASFNSRLGLLACWTGGLKPGKLILLRKPPSNLIPKLTHLLWTSEGPG